MIMTGKFECKNDIVAHDYTKECIRKASLLKNPPLPSFTKVSRKLSKAPSPCGRRFVEERRGQREGVRVWVDIDLLSLIC
jgi:hypothetical protein